MLKSWVLGGLVTALLVLPVTGCGKKANQEYLGAEAKKLAEAEAVVTVVPTTAKTPQGKPVRVYDVMVAASKQRSVVVVVGDLAVPVEIPNARFVVVGGKKAELNLASANGAYVVPVSDPICGYRQISIELDEVIKQAKTNGTMNVPLVDLFP
jgi:hypothetical protein